MRSSDTDGSATSLWLQRRGAWAAWAHQVAMAERVSDSNVFWAELSASRTAEGKRQRGPARSLLVCEVEERR